MAKLYKVQFYLTDPNNDFETSEDLKDYLDWKVRYGFMKHMHITSVDVGEWEDEHPLNQIDCPESEYKKYFNENNHEINGCEHCKVCNSFNTCVRMIREHPGTAVRCIRFGELKQYIEKENNL